MAYNGKANLIPQNKRTKSEQIDIARKGGIASGEARRKKKAFRDVVKMIGDMPIKDEKVLNKLKKMGVDVDENEITYSFLVNFSQFQKAINEKDTRAAEYLRDTLGEKPSTNQNITMDIEDLSVLGELINGDDSNN